MKINNEIKRGDILFVDLRGAEGSEQGGKRPVVVIQNNIGNKYSPTIIVATITSKLTKKQLPTHVSLPSYITPMKCDSVVLCEQLRTIDKTARISGYVGSLDESKMSEIDNAISISLGLGQREMVVA